MEQNTGLVNHPEVTAAIVHDVTLIPKLLTSEEKNVCMSTEIPGISAPGGHDDTVTHNKEGKKVC